MKASHKDFIAGIPLSDAASCRRRHRQGRRSREGVLGVGKNWELDPRFVKRAVERAKKCGVGPYFGNWRIEVAPVAAAADDRFLHVLNATDSDGGRPVECRYVRTEAEDVAFVVLPECELEGRSGVLKAAVNFNRVGAVGAKVRYALYGKDGEKPLERELVLGNAVMPQKGVFPVK